MDENLSDRISAAVEKGLEARSAFYASIELEDNQMLGAPASKSLIASLEQKLGKELPPSYREFLKLHNGWRMVDAETDLLSVEEMLEGERAAKIREWQEQAARWNDDVAGGGLVIGHSYISQSRIILDCGKTDSQGEWPLLERYKDEEVEYESFLEWLEQSALDYKEIAEAPLEDT